MRASINLLDLPGWRKLAIACCLSLFCFLGVMATNEEITIYMSAPAVPSPEIRKVYPVYVMHGSLRYVTGEESENAYFWRKKMGSLTAVPFLIALLVLITADEKSSDHSA